MIRTIALTAALVFPASTPRDGFDVTRYELDVRLGESDLAVTATVHAEGRPPERWVLELVAEMAVTSVESGGVPVAFERSGPQLALDGTAIAVANGAFDVTLRCEGAPSERFSPERGGYVRSAVGAVITYVRSQVAWYPRVARDPALYSITVDAPEEREVRTAGDFGAPRAGAGRRIWTFTTPAPIDRAGLVAGPWRTVSSGTFDSLVSPGHEKNAEALLALARAALEFHAADLGALARPRFALVEMPREFGEGSGYSECGYLLLGPGAFEAGAGASWVKGFLAHEAAHQWWGMEGLFSDFANESLAEYSMLRFLRATEGEAAAAPARRSAIERVVASAEAGKELALGEIRGWGGGLDPATYEAHAYGKAMLVLAMVERSIGAEKMSKLLARFFAAARERRVGWSDLRAALCAASKEARAIVEQWEAPGIPRVRAEHEVKKAGGTWRVTGTLVQAGTAAPFRMTVPIVALCGDESVEAEVQLSRGEAKFKLTAPAEPDAIVVDPDWQLLVARDVATVSKEAFEAAMKVANSPGEADPAVLARAIADLRRALASASLTSGEEGAAHTGLGRCLFRSGELDAAGKELEAALGLGAGGPFHRGWAHLRLGCIADLAKDRTAALEHYQAVIDASGSSGSTVEKAKAFLERPYRGYGKDG
jgi:tetratricopeptide (TPR) repeat protein